MNFLKYSSYPSIDIKKRAWPDKSLTAAPLWCSVDLRDGNQSLSTPMTVEKKLLMFKLLVEMGFKEIEVGFPAASETEFRFIRKLIDENLVPEDVTIQVITQAKPCIVKRTLESLRGSRRSIVNLYNPTSTLQREVVFKKSMKETIKEAIEAVKIIKAFASTLTDSELKLEYCPESFMAAEPEFALDLCNAVIEEWKPYSEKNMIINLAATVEMSSPNIFADLVEWFCRKVLSRQSLTISIHAHNDRGTAVSACELALMAGADRIEGTLFGNGERSGNADIIILALNMFSHGIDPNLNISDIEKIKDVYKKCTEMEIHPRHPYAGDLVFTAFSGGHQDAINKGIKAYKEGNKKKWSVPYLPIDPIDIGRTYNAIIRINSQSGKGGVSYIMENDFGMRLPVWFQPDFGHAVKRLAEKYGKELLPRQVFECFKKEYLRKDFLYKLKKFNITREKENLAAIRGSLIFKYRTILFKESGYSPLDAFVKALQKITGLKFIVKDYKEETIINEADVQYASYVCISACGQEICGADIGLDKLVVSVKAVLSALNRFLEKDFIK